MKVEIKAVETVLGILAPFSQQQQVEILQIAVAQIGKNAAPQRRRKPSSVPYRWTLGGTARGI